MEVLTRPLPHQDAPMDLSTTAQRMLGRAAAAWPRRAKVECVVESRDTMATQEAPTRYIPIPKKRHCHALPPRRSPGRQGQSPSPVRSPAPVSVRPRARRSLSPEMSRKRPRMESPKPSDLCCDAAAQRAPSADRHCHAAPPASPSFSPSPAVSASDSSGGGGGGGGEWPAMGAGLAEANGEVVVAGEGVGQSVMKPRQRSHPSSAGSSSARSPSALREEGSEAMPPAHLLTALLHMQNASLSQGMLPSPLKDTEALLSAVHQSQMLYYSYCSQLINTLRAKQIEHHHTQQQHHHHLQQQLQQQHQHQQQQQQEQQEQHLHHHHHHQGLYHHKSPHSHYSQRSQQERPRLSSESEAERRTPLEEARSYESEDTRDDLHTGEDDTLSLLRTRLNSQEPQPLCMDQRSPSLDSPSAALPSSTTGSEDMDLSPMEASGGARKRAPRALTGKHVRPGTGASASTLITLRQKLEERQKYREVYGVDPPQPIKATKGRAKKR